MSRRLDRIARPARRSNARRLTLESLEGRELLTGYSVTTTADGGTGSLRAAIIAANSDATLGADTISFNIPGSGPQTIALNSALPAITRTVVLDGTTQPGYNGTPEVVIDGGGAGAGANGLTFSSSGNLVRGLSIVGFQTNAGQGGAAIYLEGPGGSSTISSDYIGVQPDGLTAKANASGIVVASTGNIIGGPTGASGNLISGNVNAGLLLIGTGATGNIVEGNLIGTNASGTSALSNAIGVLVTGNSNTIGGTSSGASNLISGNIGAGGLTGIGVLFEDIATGNVVEGNKIGTDLGGLNPIQNDYGIYFGPNNGSNKFQTANTTIGGTVTGAGNLISGNFIGITGNTQTTLIAGNIVGLNASGTGVLSNSDGIYLGANNSTIGGTTAASRNVISGSSPIQGDVGTGMFLNGAGDLILGNYIGTNAAGGGSSVFGNVTGMVLNLVDSTIGGTTAGAGNVIAGNSGDAIQLSGTGPVGIFGNVIGQAVGGAALGNGGNGIVVTIATPPNTTPTQPLPLNDSIGGTTAGAGNIIANSGGAGIIVHNTYLTGVTGLGIRGNVIKANAKLGIDLPGIGTPLPSTLFINGAFVSGGQVTVSGVYFGTPSTVYGLDLFANAADPSGYGQGPVYLGTINVTTNASGFATFSPSFPSPSTPYTSFTATSTGPEGNTQEFSANFPLASNTPSADLSITSSSSGGTITTGTPFTLTETIVNNGSSTAGNVQLYDTLPTSLVNTSVVVSAGSASFDANNGLSANLGSIAPGQSVTVTITATASQAGSFNDQPGVSSTTFDPNYSNNFASQTINVNAASNGPSADLGIVETASSPAQVGVNLTYTLTVTNYGPNTATNATVNNFLPSSVRFVSASPSQGAAPVVSGTYISDNLGSIAPGATATLKIIVNPKTTGSIVNSANVSGNQFDINSANNSASLTTTVSPNINLILSQSVSPQTGLVGQNQIYTMTVTNQGQNAATNVTLIDSLPSGVTFINAAPTQGGPASLVNGILTDNFGTIAPGASATLTLIVRATAPGLFINYAGAYSPDVPTAPFSFAYGSVSVPSGPSVIGVARTSNNRQLVVAFDEALNASTAINKANYQLYSLGANGTGPRKAISIGAVGYNASNRLVTITPGQTINPGLYYQLVVVGSTPSGIADTLGRRLVNPQYSTPGANYTVTFYGGTLAIYG